MKKLLAGLLIFAVNISLFALPGVKNGMQDFSGEYVYYRDNSFETPAYVGFLYYDECTYAARCYTPATKKMPKKDITLYLTVDPSKDHLEFTGEKIEGLTVNEDAEIRNYLCDLFYEFAKVRGKMNSVTGDVKKLDGNSAQFGGAVKYSFTNLVPVFNIKTIENSKGKVLFNIVTTGQLTNGVDKSFVNFKGLEGLQDSKKNSFKLNKKATRKNVEFSGVNLQIDDQWEQKLENLFFLGESASLSVNLVPSQKEENFLNIMGRKFLQSTEGSYVNWQQSKLKLSDNCVTLDAVYWQPSNAGNLATVTRDFKILRKNSDGNYEYFDLTVFENIYQKNKDYFDGIVESF